MKTEQKRILSMEDVWWAKKRFIAFDVETTGLSRQKDRIIELGAVLFENGQVKDTFSTLVNAGIPVPWQVSRIHHITNAMLASAPNEREAYAAFLDFIRPALQEDVLMAAHNAAFDFGFLKQTLERLDIDGSLVYVDTLKLAKKAFPQLENHKQATIERHLGLQNKSRHRALDDAVICGHIFYKLLNLQ